MNILIFGKGFVGQHFADYYGEQALLSDYRVEDFSGIVAELKRLQPKVVINCIGKTGSPNVDWCEDHKVETLFGNVTVPLLIARACAELGIYMVHVGSGCVYSGDKDGEGFSECDEPNFAGSFYSKTKAWSEAMLNEFPVLQLRLRMPLDGAPGPRNFITKITKYAKVISVPNSISVIEDFIKAADALIQKRATGIYNMTNPGAITHEEILKMYQEIVDPSFQINLMTLEELGAVTKAGRSNCALSMKKLESEGIHMRPVHEAVRDALEQYKTHMV